MNEKTRTIQECLDTARNALMNTPKIQYPPKAIVSQHVYDLCLEKYGKDAVENFIICQL